MVFPSITNEPLPPDSVTKRMEGRRTSLLDVDSTSGKLSLGGLGGGMLLAGTLALAGWRRREKSER